MAVRKACQKCIMARWVLLYCLCILLIAGLAIKRFLFI